MLKFDKVGKITFYLGYSIAIIYSLFIFYFLSAHFAEYLQGKQNNPNPIQPLEVLMMVFGFGFVLIGTCLAFKKKLLGTLIILSGFFGFQIFAFFEKNEFILSFYFLVPLIAGLLMLSGLLWNTGFPNPKK